MWCYLLTVGFINGSVRTNQVQNVLGEEKHVNIISLAGERQIHPERAWSDILPSGQIRNSLAWRGSSGLMQLVLGSSGVWSEGTSLG